MARERGRRILIDGTMARGGGGFTYLASILSQLSTLAPADRFRVLLRNERLAQSIPALPNVEIDLLPDVDLAAAPSVHLLRSPAPDRVVEGRPGLLGGRDCAAAGAMPDDRELPQSNAAGGTTCPTSIIGDVQHPGYFAQMQRACTAAGEELAERIHFVGEVPYADVTAYYASALPALEEAVQARRARPVSA